MAITIKQRRPAEGAGTSGPPTATRTVVSPLQPLLLAGVVLAAALFFALTLLPLFTAAGRAAMDLEERLAPPHVDVRKLFPPVPQRSTILAADHSSLATVYLENRKVVRLKNVSEAAQRAILAIEDYQFYEHGGVDIKAILRAAIANLQAGHITQGGSTITQQLVKNVTGKKADTFRRKLREAQIANAVEKVYTKKQILQRYLNEIYLGHGAYGVEAAAEAYFNEEAGELTLRQSAMIAGLIANPSVYDPIEHPAAALHRRNVILNRMEEIGWVGPRAAARTKRRPLGLAKNAGKPFQQHQPFWVQFVRKLIELDPNHQFRALGKTPKQRIHTLYVGGLHIYTTLRPDWQQAAVKAVQRRLPKSTDPQAGVATVQPGTGAVQVLVSGRHFAATRQDLVSGLPGCGTQGFCGRRQTGSAFKPFTLVAAFRQGIPPGKVYSSKSPVDLSEPCNGWKPFNAEGGGDLGYMDLYSATALSINVIFGQLARDTGPPNIRKAAMDLGIPGDSLPGGPEDCSITLGTGSVSPLDMATAYAAIDNNGEYCPYFAVSRITGPRGGLVYRHDAQKECHQAVDAGIAHQVTDMLRGVIQFGTGATNGQLYRPEAGKTGTNENYQDAWFVGYVPQETTAVWVGYPGNPRPMLGVEGVSEMFGGTIPTQIWHDVMSTVIKGMPPRDFPLPPPPKSGTVPSVVGQPEDAALKHLAKANFSGVVDARKASTEPEGTVIGQSPGGGATVPLGSLVHLTVSNGKAPKGNVPDVRGLSQADATSKLEAHGFDVTVVPATVHEKSQDGIVISQSPSPGTRVLDGATVVITVGHYEKPAPSPSPKPKPSPSPTPTRTPKPKPKPKPTHTKSPGG
jgi:membrane peptidoglycan carboxypeptidase